MSRTPSASQGPQAASASKGSNISDATIRASSAARYFSLLLLTILVTFHSGIAVNAFSSAMQEWKQCPSSYGGSSYLIFVLVEVVYISIHACGLFLVWREKLDVHQHADCMLLITCCWPIINLTGALTVSVMLFVII